MERNVYTTISDYEGPVILDYWKDGKLYTFTGDNLYVFSEEAQRHFPTKVYWKLVKRRFKVAAHALKWLLKSIWLMTRNFV